MPTRSHRLAAIVNPRSGGWRRLRDAQARADPAAAVARWLASENSESVFVRETRGAGEGRELALQAIAQGCDTIVAVGGDGTINEVLQGICSVPVEARPRLGILPMGTVNVLARVLGLPVHEPPTAARAVLESHVRQIDVGRANGRWFVLGAGVGFDARVIQRVDSRLKQHLGRIAYILAILRTLWSYPRCPLTITLDDGDPQSFDAYLALIANGDHYAGGFRLGPDVQPNDGLLDVFLCLRRRPFACGVFAHALALVRHRLYAAPAVRHFRARRIVIDAAQPLPVQLDGDLAGTTPVTLEVTPSALRVLAPNSGSDGLR